MPGGPTMFMYAVKKPAEEAVRMLGEDGVAVYCDDLRALAACATGDVPDEGATVAIFHVEKSDIHDGDRWLPGVGSIAELVFDTPEALVEKLAGRFEGSAFAVNSLKAKIASQSGMCDVITGINIHRRLAAQMDAPVPVRETKAAGQMDCPVREIAPGEIRAPYIVAREAAQAAGRGVRTDAGGNRTARLRGPSNGI